MARVVGMKAGVPKEAPAFTVNRLCGSGLQAIVSACQSIQTGEASVALAGGAESMSRAPYWFAGGRWGARMGDAPLIDPVLGALTDPFGSILMGVTAENLAERGSHLPSAPGRVRAALASACVGGACGRPVRLADRARGGQGPAGYGAVRRGRAHSRGRLAREPREAEAGVQARWNGHGGECLWDERCRRSRRADVVGARADELGVVPRARILAYASCGVDPSIMGIGPVPAVRKVMDRAGRSLDEVDVIELNEAFAAQALAVIDDLGLDEEKVNPNGGAIALGHPIGATGAAITAKILDEMDRADLSLGLVTLCIGGGQGIAMLLERDG